MAYSAKTGTRRALLFCASGVLLAGIVASRSRGGFVCLAVTWVALVVMSHRRILMLGATAIACAGLLLLAPPDYFDEMKTMQDQNDSTRQARFNMWTVAWDAFLDNPVLGVGQGNMPWRMNDYQVWDDRTGRSYAGQPVHSFYFTLFAELGIVGTTMYAWCVALTVKDCWRVMRRRQRVMRESCGPYARAMMCALVAYLAGGAFISVLYYPHLYYLVAASLALRRISDREERDDVARSNADAAREHAADNFRGELYRLRSGERCAS
jgi:O-antigen ligase